MLCHVREVQLQMSQELVKSGSINGLTRWRGACWLTAFLEQLHLQHNQLDLSDTREGEGNL